MLPASSTAAERPLLRIVVAGHVDHGKSSLIGRLLYETNSLLDGRFDELKAASVRRAMPLEWSFLVDALQAERDQAITIDSTQIWFRTDNRDYVIIDAPGHREFLRNMITGAAGADAALLVVDATEGLREQTRRHAYILHLLGITRLTVVVNKMDLAGYSQATFNAVSADITGYLRSLGIAPSAVIPISAREGDNIAVTSAKLGWYAGQTLLQALDTLPSRAPQFDLPLRMPIQDVYKFDERRIFVGKVESGTLSVGDRLLFSPSNVSARVRSIEIWGSPDPVLTARAGQSAGFTLEDQIFAERGHVASHAERPPFLTQVFNATIFWLSKRPLRLGDTVKLRCGMAETRATVREIRGVVDTETLSRRNADEICRNDVAEVTLRVADLLPVDDFSEGMRLSRFVLSENYEVVGGGLISTKGYPDQRTALAARSTNISSVEHRVSAEHRAERNRHRGGVLWLTGLSGSGKSTLAMELERRLFALGYQVYVLDGDNLRRGLNANLGFSPEDRSENIRRAGEAAALFADAGVICIAALISPYQADRDRARVAAGNAFREIYVKASIDACERRDPKGLYRRARSGEIADFTGITAPYEEPTEPALILDTERMSVEDCVEALLGHVTTSFGCPG